MVTPSNTKTAASVRPAHNAFSLLDHQTGRYMRGKNNAWYLNGGLHHIMGWCGRGNTFKTAVAAYVSVIVAVRQMAGWFEVFDTEMSFNYERLNDFLVNMPEANEALVKRGLDPIYAEDMINEGKWNITTLVEQLGDEWWKARREDADERMKIKGKDLRVTPFYEIDGTQRKTTNPWIYLVDSLTELKVASVEKMHDKAVVGNSDLNTEAMKSGAAKSQMMAQMPIVTGRGNYFVSLTAHVGDEIKMDQYAPSHRKLAGLKGDLKLKGIPEKFTFLTNNCYMATATAPLLDDQKMPKFPHPAKEPTKGDTDLQVVRFEQLRGKSGPTGYFLDLIFSQTEGLLVGLTEFYFILELCKGYGLDIKGNNMGFRLDIYPELYFTRRNVREFLNTDPKFRRAMAITAACAYMHFYWIRHPADMRMPMADLYERVKSQGYDWDEILSETVEYWYYEDMAEIVGKPTLTAYTLQKMALGEHHATYLKTHPKELVATKIVHSADKVVKEEDDVLID